ncbi:Uncharacterised protein [Clostridium putrefaciens]|uniref:Uncharacterized protein n=1 Tax=Clostridium putrefaciens TaxID=99675 RepID=A0A381J6Z8_9CLOT|nr:hypothetical protein [Clostridium putrefaciens]SUY45775.1 Uncharacterised protein [Clostridium putrefaciens]
MDENFKELLGKFKEQLTEGCYENEVDTMTVIEDSNPTLTKDSRKYKESKKRIFKQQISISNAESIINTIKDTKYYNIGNLRDYKGEVRSKAERTIISGENPIEMLVYGIKGLHGNELFINAVRDVVKELYLDYSDDVIGCYKSILLNWNWNDCLEFVLKSISESYITDLADEVYYVLENNNILRENAVNTLVAINSTKHYDSMINLLCTDNNSTGAEFEIIGKSLKSFVKADNDNTYYVYKAYISLSVPSPIKNILIGIVRTNLNKRILDDIEALLKDYKISIRESNKIMDLLKKCKERNRRGEKVKNEKVMEILNTALTYNHLNKGRIEIALGADIPDIQNEIIFDTTRSIRERANAIIAMSLHIDDISLKSLQDESDVMNVIVSSVRVQRGYINSLIPLFQFIVQKDEGDMVSIEATNQIKRLRGLKDENLNNQLMKVAEGLLQDDSDQNTRNVMKILDLFSSGIPSDVVGSLYLDKLKNTKQSKVKIRILEFYKKEYNRFSTEIKNKISESVILCTREKSISNVAMDCLKSINAYVDSTPGVKKDEGNI